MIRNWRGRLLAVSAVCIAIAVVTTSESVLATDVGAVDALMLRLMSMDNVPGAALALIKDGRIVLEKGYGFRDLATHAPITTTTLFNIGSISKSFTVLGVAQLVDQQQVELSTPVIRYIPDLRLSDPVIAQAVTLRQLLSHTSGLPADERWPHPVPPRLLVSSPTCQSPRRQGHGFNIAADVSYSLPTPLNGSPANHGKRTLGHISLNRSG